MSHQRHRWIKFWPQDWQRDPALRSCGIAARGLWIDLICLAHDAVQYGHILVNGKSPDTKQIAAITGITHREANKLMLELEAAGVFSRTSDGIIYSRRMVRDGKLSDAGREAVARRWDQPTDRPNSEPIRLPIRDFNRLPKSLDTEYKNQTPPLPPLGGTGVILNGNGVHKEPPCPENNFTGWEPASGRETVGGYYWDFVWPNVLEASGVRAADDKPVRQWLKDGIEPDAFLPVIRRIAERADYRPPKSLAYFDAAIRREVRT